MLETTPVGPRARVIAVLTCFNRRLLTLACLAALEESSRVAGVDLSVVLVDDASTDGTAAAVRAQFPWVEVIDGQGDLYWNRGMHQGFARALSRDADHYLWLNDDTHLVPAALSMLLDQGDALRRREGKSVVMVGATVGRDSGKLSYGGRVARDRLRRFNYTLVWSEREPVPCQAMEGNCVLIPREIADKVGNLDPTFEHAMGDTDYGLRVQAAGYKLFVAPGIVGHCSVNPTGGTYFDSSLPLATRWRLIRSRKGLPVRSWLHFTRRHGGVLWPLHFAWPYARVLLSGVGGVLRRRHSNDKRVSRPA